MTYSQKDTKKIIELFIEKIKNTKNPYPRDVFTWDNQGSIKIIDEQSLQAVIITRGRFNKFIYQVVENTKQNIIKIIEEGI